MCKILTIMILMYSSNGALACTFDAATKLLPDSYFFLGIVVDFVSVNVSQHGHPAQEFGGVVIVVENHLVGSSKRHEYEVFPMGTHTDCTRSGRKLDDLSSWLNVGDLVFVVARPFHFREDDLEDRQLEAWIIDGGYIRTVPDAMKDYDFHSFDFKRYREFSRQRPSEDQVRYMQLAEFATLVSINQLKMEESEVERNAALERLIYALLDEKEYRELVDLYARDATSAAVLIEKYRESR